MTPYEHDPSSRGLTSRPGPPSRSFKVNEGGSMVSMDLSRTVSDRSGDILLKMQTLSRASAVHAPSKGFCNAFRLKKLS